MDPIMESTMESNRTPLGLYGQDWGLRHFLSAWSNARINRLGQTDILKNWFNIQSNFWSDIYFQVIVAHIAKQAFKW